VPIQNPSWANKTEQKRELFLRKNFPLSTPSKVENSNFSLALNFFLLCSLSLSPLLLPPHFNKRKKIVTAKLFLGVSFHPTRYSLRVFFVSPNPEIMQGALSGTPLARRVACAPSSSARGELKEIVVVVVVVVWLLCLLVKEEAKVALFFLLPCFSGPVLPREEARYP